jgi:hypothetical protein
MIAPSWFSARLRAHPALAAPFTTLPLRAASTWLRRAAALVTWLVLLALSAGEADAAPAAPEGGEVAVSIKADGPGLHQRASVQT